MLEVAGFPSSMLHRFYYPLSIPHHADLLTQLTQLPRLMRGRRGRGTLARSLPKSSLNRPPQLKLLPRLKVLKEPIKINP